MNTNSPFWLWNQEIHSLFANLLMGLAGIIAIIVFSLFTFKNDHPIMHAAMKAPVVQCQANVSCVYDPATQSKWAVE